MNRSIIRRKHQGFTLVELMIVLIVLAILTTAGMPFYQSFVSGQRIKSASFDLMALITFARSEAIKRNTTIVLNGNGATFTVSLTNGTVLRQQPMFTGVQLDCVNMGTSPHSYTPCPTTGLAYNGNGRQANTAQYPAFLPIEIHEINASSNPVANYRCITIDLSGRPNSQKGKC